ncbi:MAG: hypothetical protein P8Y18_01800 [Candidatus Bathyarchaeota archaeon]
MTEVVVDDLHPRDMSCIGKKHGCDCSNCLMRSWCDGIPSEKSIH